jgi:hypothetical protein
MPLSSDVPIISPVGIVRHLTKQPASAGKENKTMKSYMLITGLLLSLAATAAFSDELANRAGQNDLTEIMRQQSEAISQATQQRASGIAIGITAAKDQRGDQNVVPVSKASGPQELSRALLLATLDSPSLQ